MDISSAEFQFKKHVFLVMIGFTYMFYFNDWIVATHLHPQNLWLQFLIILPAPMIETRETTSMQTELASSDIDWSLLAVCNYCM